jgi:glycosyltransferase involved in cell wall biosynthesis
MTQIDVLISAYNAGATIDVAMASMVGQTFTDFRIVVVDDGSTDDTAKRLADWAARDPRVVPLFLPENRGIVDAVNHGLSYCEAEFIARFDADDISFPSRLQNQLDFLRSNPGHAAVGARVEHIDEAGTVITGLPHPGAPENSDASLFPAREPYLIQPFTMLRRDALVEVGGYRHLPTSEDSDLFWRLQERWKLSNVEQVLGQYRIHSSSISSASVLNGRVMSITSQLSALSALRRRTNRDDFAFRASDGADLKAARHLEGMVQVFAARLGPDDLPRLRLAAGIKLLEMSHYRPYEIEIDDARFIRSALSRCDLATPANRGDIRWHVTKTAARLFRKGKVAEAFALCPWNFLPRAAVRAVLD